MNAINYTNLRDKMLKKYGNPEHYTRSIKHTNYCKFEVKVNGVFVCEIIMSVAQRNHFTRSKYYLKGVTLGGMGCVNPKKYLVYNSTDGFPAYPELITYMEAQKWINNFKRNLKKHQGYYLTGDRERIPVSSVEFRFQPI